MLLLSVNPIAGQGYKGDSWSSVNSKGSGVLSIVYFEQPGIIYKAADGNVKGVCADILNDFVAYVQSKHNKTISINYAGRETSFADFLKVSQTTPNILGVSNVTITEERKKILKFTPAFMPNIVAVITHRSAPDITSLGEIASKFSGYSVETIPGSSYLRYIDLIKERHVPDLKLSFSKSGPEALTKVANNPKLFTILDFTEFLSSRHRGLPIKCQNIDFKSVEELGFIMSKGTDWDAIWKEFLTDEYRNSVRYRKILSDNLGPSFMSLAKKL